MSSRPSGFAPLRHRGFRLLVGGQLVSNVGDAFYAVALPWYVLANHGGALLLAAVLAAYGIPRTLLVAVGGHASDRWHPWVVMMAADVVRAVVVAVLAVMAHTGAAGAAFLVPIAAVIGAGEGLFLPGSFSIIPQLLPDADLQGGNAFSSGATQLATMIGPAIGGVLVAVSGPATVFAVDAASFVVSAATLAGIRSLKLGASAGEPTVAGLAAGELATAGLPAGSSPGTDGQLVAEPDVTAAAAAANGSTPQATSLRQMIRSERVLQVILLVTLAANLGSGGVGEVALPALADGPFDSGAAGYGALIACFGGGALVGTLAAGQIGGFRRPAIVASWAFLVEALLMAIVPFTGSTAPAAVILLVFGALNGFGNVITITAFQRWAPPDWLGRLMGIVLFASFGMFPVSVVLAGVIVHRFGPEPFFVVSAIVLAVAVLAGLTQPTWRQFGATSAAEDLAPASVQEAMAVAEAPAPVREAMAVAEAAASVQEAMAVAEARRPPSSATRTQCPQA